MMYPNLCELALFLATPLCSAFITCYITLWLTDRKTNREAQVRFENRLTSLAYELSFNMKYGGTHLNPFHTKALENLVYNEPLIHNHPDLFLKAQHCLNIAFILSTSSLHYHLNPAHGRELMEELLVHLANYHAIKIDPLKD